MSLIQECLKTVENWGHEEVPEIERAVDQAILSRPRKTHTDQTRLWRFSKARLTQSLPARFPNSGPPFQ